MSSPLPVAQELGFAGVERRVIVVRVRDRRFERAFAEAAYRRR
jgi:hypothetical protein